MCLKEFTITQNWQEVAVPSWEPSRSQTAPRRRHWPGVGRLPPCSPVSTTITRWPPRWTPSIASTRCRTLTSAAKTLPPWPTSEQQRPPFWDWFSFLWKEKSCCSRVQLVCSSVLVTRWVHKVAIRWILIDCCPLSLRSHFCCLEEVIKVTTCQCLNLCVR